MPLLDREITRCALAVEALRATGSLRMCAQGTSMLPALWPGDILWIEQVPAATARVGEIVLWLRDGMLVAHRVVRVTGSTEHPIITCSGDFVQCEDAPVSAEFFLGRVVRVVRASRDVSFSASHASRWKRGFGELLRRSFWFRTLALRVHHWRVQRTEGILSSLRAGETKV